MKTKNEKKTTTIAVPVADNGRLTEYCQTYNILKKDFISVVLNYLENNGVDPKKDHAPKTELAKINRRINQLFAFIKTQDKEYLRPMLEAVQETEFRLENQIDSLAKKSELEDSIGKKIRANFYDKKEQFELVKLIISETDKDRKKDASTIQFRKDVLKTLEDLKNKKGFNW